MKMYPLNAIYFYLTEGCNLKCRHCWIDPSYHSPDSERIQALDIELFKSVIEQAKPLGLRKVKLTGGEPLLHPKINEILELIKSEEMMLTVETNGTLCTESLAEKIASVSTDVTVSVSIDGADAEMHEWVRGVSGSFNMSLQGIANLVKAGIAPQIIMTIMKRNRHQIEQLIRLAEQIGAASVKFNPVQPTARGDIMHVAMDTLTIEELVELGKWVDNELSLRTKLNLVYTHPIAFRSLSRMFGESGNGCTTCGILGILGILSDGSYSLCGIGQTVPDLVFGPIHNTSLTELWQNHPTLVDLRSGFPSKMQGVCGECLLNTMCKSSCVAQNYYSTKSLWAPYWYCDSAYRAGIFPKSRLRVE